MNHAPTAETRHQPFEKMELHRHARPYAALVLDGGFEEHGPDGRFVCEVGSLLVRPPWQQHADEFGKHGAIVLNLPIESVDGFLHAHVSNVEAVASLAARSPRLAGFAVLEEAQRSDPVSPAAWLEEFTMKLVSQEGSSIAEVASECGVSHEHASRACKRWFGVSPAQFRRENRIKRAIDLLECGATPAEAAYDAGFSDQPHLTRILKKATGMTPAAFSIH